jgi:hypothetical protein
VVRAVFRLLLVSALAPTAAAELVPPPLPIVPPARVVHLESPELVLPSGLRLPFVVAPGPSSRFPASQPQVPVTPGSAALALLAVGGIGVWQISRSTRKLDRGWLPGWYHSSGPRQVGRATPLEVDWTGIPQPTFQPLPCLPALESGVLVGQARPRGRPVLMRTARAPPFGDYCVVISDRGSWCFTDRFLQIGS